MPDLWTRTTRSANTSSPVGGAGEVRRVRECLLRNHEWGGCPPAKGLPFGTRARRFSVPLRAATALRVGWSEPGHRIGALSPRIPRHCWRAPETDAASLLDLGPSPLLPGRRPSARGHRMGPSTSRRGKRRPYCISQPRHTGDCDGELAWEYGERIADGRRGARRDLVSRTRAPFSYPECRTDGARQNSEAT